MAFPSETYVNQIVDPAVRAEFQQMYSLLQGYLSQQHKDTGAHSDITADSVDMESAIVRDNMIFESPAALAVLSGASATFAGDAGFTGAVTFVGTGTTFLIAPAFDSGFTERSRSVKAGEWTSPTFSAGDYTASSGTWTVDSGDITTLAYTLIGKTMTVLFDIETTDVSATPTFLKIAIPGGFTAAKETRTLIQTVDAGTIAVGMARVAASGTGIELYKTVAAAAWSTTAGDNTAVRGQLTFEVS